MNGPCVNVHSDQMCTRISERQSRGSPANTGGRLLSFGATVGASPLLPSHTGASPHVDQGRGRRLPPCAHKPNRGQDRLLSATPPHPRPCDASPWQPAGLPLSWAGGHPSWSDPIKMHDKGKKRVSQEVKGVEKAFVCSPVQDLNSQDRRGLGFVLLGGGRPSSTG